MVVDAGNALLSTGQLRHMFICNPIRLFRPDFFLPASSPAPSTLRTESLCYVMLPCSECSSSARLPILSLSINAIVSKNEQTKQMHNAGRRTAVKKRRSETGIAAYACLMTQVKQLQMRRGREFVRTVVAAGMSQEQRCYRRTRTSSSASSSLKLSLQRANLRCFLLAMC